MTDAPGIGHNSSGFDLAAEAAEKIIEQYNRVPVENMTVEQAKLAIVLVKQARLAEAAVKESWAVTTDAAVLAHLERGIRAAKLRRDLDDIGRTVTGLVDAVRKREKLQTIVSDYGPKAYAKRGTILSIDPFNLAPEYWEPNYDKIKADLKAGKAIAGVAEIDDYTTVIS